jgi:hypothetical protein
MDSSGRTIYNFQETGRDDWSVYLNDASRDVQLQLDLHRRKVSYGTNGGARSDLYDIVSARSAIAPAQQVVTPAAQKPPKFKAGADLSQAVNGRNVEIVQTAGGSFRNQPGGGWVEMDSSGRTAYNFQETGRDDWSVYLNDASRDVQLQLDLHRRKVSYGTNGGARSDLYDIVDARRATTPAQRTPVPTSTQRAPTNAYPSQNRTQPAVRSRSVNAGPIWDQRDAELKCPVAAHAVNGRWTGGWRTTVTGQMSVCDIAY